MTKLMSGLAVATLLACAMGGQATAQDRTFKRIVAGQPAKLQGAMTQSQARQVCKTQLAGTRESKAGLRKKMDFCVNEQMQGR